MPASRVLARQLGVSRTTTTCAYEQLASEGYLQMRRGAGTFVASGPLDLVRSTAPPRRVATRRPPKLSRYGRRIVDGLPAHRAPPPSRDAPPFDFAPGLPDWTLFPTEKWRREVSACTRDLGETFGYLPPNGLLELRRAIARYVRSARAAECTPEQVIVVGGTQQAARLVARVLLDEGDTVLMEDPCYPSVANVFRSEGLELVPGRVDEEGLDLGSFAARDVARAHLAYVTPSHQFPTGAILSYPRRLALFEWARARDAFIMEDDYDSEFRYEGRPIQSLQGMAPDSVIYTGTFSKTMHPSLRLAYLVVPEVLVEPLQKASAVEGFGSPGLLQDAMARFIESGEYASHVRRARTRYHRRRDALVDSVRRHFEDRVTLSGPRAGLHVLALLPDLPSSAYRALREAARRRGVRIYSAAPCYASPPEHVALILGYAALDEDHIRRGIRALALAKKDVGTTARYRSPTR